MDGLTMDFASALGDDAPALPTTTLVLTRALGDDAPDFTFEAIPLDEDEEAIEQCRTTTQQNYQQACNNFDPG